MTTDRPRADRRPVPPHVWVILILGGGAFLLAALVALVVGYVLLRAYVL